VHGRLSLLITSLPDLTRQTIILVKNVFRWMRGSSPRMTILEIGIPNKKGPGKTGAFDVSKTQSDQRE
jgi:hypothetical protein